jgi:hypothetical protein
MIKSYLIKKKYEQILARFKAAILDRDQTNGIQFRLGTMQGIFQPSSVHINIGKHFQRRVLNDCFA